MQELEGRRDSGPSAERAEHQRLGSRAGLAGAEAIGGIQTQPRAVPRHLDVEVVLGPPPVNVGARPVLEDELLFADDRRKGRPRLLADDAIQPSHRLSHLA